MRAERLAGAVPLALAAVVIAFADIAAPLRALLLCATLGLTAIWLRTLRAPVSLARWRASPGWGLEPVAAVEPTTGTLASLNPATVTLASVTSATRVYAGHVLLELRAADGGISRHLVSRRTLSAADRRRLRVRLWLGHG